MSASIQSMRLMLRKYSLDQYYFPKKFRRLSLGSAVLLCLLMCSLFLPISYGESAPARDRYDQEVVIVLDISLSMLAADNNGNTRLSVVQKQVIQFINQNKYAKFTLVAFDDEAFPLMVDSPDYLQAIRYVEGLYPKHPDFSIGTNTKGAFFVLQTILEEYQRFGVTKKPLLFFSDGESNIQPERYTVDYEFLVDHFDTHIYGVGTTEGGSMLWVDPKGVKPDQKVNDRKTSDPAESFLDEESLQTLSDKLVGEYRHLDDVDLSVISTQTKSPEHFVKDKQQSESQIVWVISILMFLVILFIEFPFYRMKRSQYA